jgi:hypothetical protein
VRNVEKKQAVKHAILFGYATLLMGWFLLYFTWFRAWIDGGTITIRINYYGEALPEFLLMPILTLFSILGYVHLVKWMHGEKFEEPKNPTHKFLQENIRLMRINKKTYGYYIFLGLIMGYVVADFMVYLVNFQSFYIGTFHVHHLYLGVIGFMITLIINRNVGKKITANQRIFLIIISGIFLGIALHDVVLHILESKFDVFYSFDLGVAKKIL